MQQPPRHQPDLCAELGLLLVCMSSMRLFQLVVQDFDLPVQAISLLHNLFMPLLRIQRLFLSVLHLLLQMQQLPRHHPDLCPELVLLLIRMLQARFKQIAQALYAQVQGVLLLREPSMLCSNICCRSKFALCMTIL